MAQAAEGDGTDRGGPRIVGVQLHVLFHHPKGLLELLPSFFSPSQGLQGLGGKEGRLIVLP